MVCSHCGSEIPDGSSFCNRCGKALSPYSGLSTAASAAQPGVQLRTSGKAVASLITGVLFFILPSAIAAIVLGHISRSEIRKSGGRLQGKGMALAGLLMGYMGLCLPFFLIVAAIVIPNLLRARIAANEATAVHALRSIAVAEMRYAQSRPEGGFTCDLNELSSAKLIDAQVASGIRRGYVISLQNCTDSHGYQSTARPVVFNQTGVRAFCSDQSAVIRFDAGGSEENCLQNGVPLR